MCLRRRAARGQLPPFASAVMGSFERRLRTNQWTFTGRPCPAHRRILQIASDGARDRLAPGRGRPLLKMLRAAPHRFRVTEDRLLAVQLGLIADPTFPDSVHESLRRLVQLPLPRTYV